MSRNFELLTQIDREGELLSQLSSAGAPTRVPARMVGLPAQYEPLINFVQRVFLGIDMGAPRMVVFTGADRSSGCSWICAHTAKVLAASSSRREAARSAVEKLKAANVPLLGAVLNKRTFPIPDLIYSKL